MSKCAPSWWDLSIGRTVARPAATDNVFAYERRWPTRRGRRVMMSGCLSESDSARRLSLVSLVKHPSRGWTARVQSCVGCGAHRRRQSQKQRENVGPRGLVSETLCAIILVRPRADRSIMAVRPLDRVTLRIATLHRTLLRHRRSAILTSPTALALQAGVVSSCRRALFGRSGVVHHCSGTSIPQIRTAGA